MASYEDLWYAARSTRIVYAPPRVLETFGETSVRYYMLTEMMDTVGQLRLRQGQVTAERPRVIMPRYFVNNVLVNFGPDAREYIAGALRSTEGLRIIEYGLQFRKEEYSEEVVQGNIADVADQVAKDAKANERELCGVIVGVDDHWEVSLLHFIHDVVRRSLPHNTRDMASRGLLQASSNNVPNAVRIEIESDFRAAHGNRDKAKALGEKLRGFGLFEEYEDRFFELFRSSH
jgi:hypothetical protein